MIPADRPIVPCLMGPTASGKTETAIELADTLSLDIVSVDSAMVYRGMNIGTAKPDAATLQRAPHRLVDIREPEDAYSAGDFVRDAGRAMTEIFAAGRVPLLVGGTMLYFRALIEGIAELPEADPATRQALDREADEKGWPVLHAELAAVDPAAAERIAPADRQRIQRALEVYRVSGRPLSDWQSAATAESPFAFLKVALVDDDRARLHRRIDSRFHSMLDAGFLAEVETLQARPGLTADSPSMRSVGYRQLWAHLEGHYDLDTAVQRGQAATRQLAKRQLTWLRSETELSVFDPLDPASGRRIGRLIRDKMNQC